MVGTRPDLEHGSGPNRGEPIKIVSHRPLVDQFVDGAFVHFIRYHELGYK